MRFSSRKESAPCRRLAIVGVAVFALLMAGCGGGAGSDSANDSGGSVSTTDMSGADVTLDHPAKRIVAVGSSSLDALATAGVAPIAVSGAAWEGAAQLPETFKDQIGSIKQLAQTADGVSAEAVAALQPDLIFINLNGLNQRESLQKIAPVAVVDSGSNGLDGALQALSIVGTLTDHSTEAKKAQAVFKNRLQAYEDALDDSGVPEKTMLVMSDGTRNFKVATTTSSTCDMLSKVGKCPFEVKSQAKAYLAYSIESVRKINPDIIFLRDEADVSPDLAANPFWQDLDAVKNGEVYHVNRGLWVLGGTIALTKVLDEAMPKAYPSVFDSPLPTT